MMCSSECSGLFTLFSQRPTPTRFYKKASTPKVYLEATPTNRIKQLPICLAVVMGLCYIQLDAHSTNAAGCHTPFSPPTCKWCAGQDSRGAPRVSISAHSCLGSHNINYISARLQASCRLIRFANPWDHEKRISNSQTSPRILKSTISIISTKLPNGEMRTEQKRNQTCDVLSNQMSPCQTLGPNVSKTLGQIMRNHMEVARSQSTFVKACFPE